MLRHLPKMLTTDSQGLAAAKKAGPLVTALVLTLALAACGVAKPVTGTVEGEFTQPAGDIPTALRMRQGLSLPPGVIETVRPEGFEASPMPAASNLAELYPDEVPLSVELEISAKAPMLADAFALPMTDGGFGVHVTSYRNRDSIEPGLAEMYAGYGGELEGLTPIVNLETVEGQGQFYRLKFGPFSSHEAAQASCDRIKIFSDYCSVVVFTGEPL